MAEERLQKVLAARGVASRRAAEELIQGGRVSVDGRVVLELGTKVDPERATIKVDGRALPRPRPTYVLLNKPRGYVTTASDPEGRRTVYDLLDLRERVFPVGRLDMDSEGLLLLTNDGELANRVAHPRYRLDKEYHALVEGAPSPGALAQLRRGGFLVGGGRTSPAEVAVVGQEAGGTWLRVIIHEGRKRQVRRMLEEIGHPVRRLRRIRLGPLTLEGMPAASYRRLTAREVARLRRLVGLEGDETPAETSAAAAGEADRPIARRAPTRTLGAGRPRDGRGGAKSASKTPARAKRSPEPRQRQPPQPASGARQRQRPQPAPGARQSQTGVRGGEEHGGGRGRGSGGAGGDAGGGTGPGAGPRGHGGAGGGGGGARPGRPARPGPGRG